MTLLVDTSVWSLAFRRDQPPGIPEVGALRMALDGGDTVLATGLVLQELLQGFTAPRSRERLLAHFAALPFISPARADHVEAAELRNRCRKSGIQIGTIDALLAQLCIRHGLTLLSTDRDFLHVAACSNLRIWKSA